MPALVFAFMLLFVLTLRAMRASTVVRDLKKCLWHGAIVCATALAFYGGQGWEARLCLCAAFFSLRYWGVERCCLYAVVLLLCAQHHTDGFTTVLGIYTIFCLHYGFGAKHFYTRDMLSRILYGCVVLASAVIFEGFRVRSFSWVQLMGCAWVPPALVVAGFVWAGVYPLPTMCALARHNFQQYSLGYWLGGGLLLVAGASGACAQAVFFSINALFLLGCFVMAARSSYDVWGHALTIVWLWLVYAFVLMCELGVRIIPVMLMLALFVVVRSIPGSMKLPILWSVLWGGCAGHPAWWAFAFWPQLSTVGRVLLLANMLATVFFGSVCWTTQHFSIKKIMYNRTYALFHGMFMVCVGSYVALGRCTWNWF